MFGLINPIYKLLGIAGLVVALFGFGYWKGYSSEHEKFLAYKQNIAVQVAAQEEVNKSVAKQQQIKTEGIINEYKAKLATLRLNANRLQYNPNSVQVPEAKSTGGTFTAPSYPVLTGQCLETTLMLVSLQEWVKFISE